MKTMKTIQLVGVTAEGVPATNQQAHLVTAFVSTLGNNHCKINFDGSVTYTTSKDKYLFIEHKSINRYQGMAGKNKAHIILKKVVGKIVYWA